MIIFSAKISQKNAPPITDKYRINCSAKLEEFGPLCEFFGGGYKI
jgi:hypothetical protein